MKCPIQMEHKTQMLSGIAHFDGLRKRTRISGQDSAGQDSSPRLAGPTNHPLDFENYVDLYHPWASPNFYILKYVDLNHRQLCFLDFENYVDLYHPWASLNCYILKYVDLNHQHSWVFLILTSMLTCITHGYHWIASSKSMLTWITNIVVFSWFWKVCWLDEVCWLASPMYVLDLMKYADMHHPCVF